MKKILITAGPTWVKIDAVRIITNIFTGRLGYYLAVNFSREGFSVDLLINPCFNILKEKNIHILKFSYWDEFRKKLKTLLVNNNYSLIIHSAAVSDYYYPSASADKIPSQRKKLTLVLKPAPKLTNLIRKYAKGSLLVQFKLEKNERGLIEKAYQSLKKNNFHFVVANALSRIRKDYQACVIDRDKNILRIKSKKELFNFLLEKIRK